MAQVVVFDRGYYIEFSIVDLIQRKFFIPNVFTSQIAVEDNSGLLVYPDIKTKSNGVEIDFTGWKFEGAWKVYVVNAFQGVQGIQGENAKATETSFVSICNFFGSPIYTTKKIPIEAYIEPQPAPTLPEVVVDYQASGFSQLMDNGTVLPAVIPNKGVNRQWFYRNKPDDLNNIYNFQISRSSLFLDFVFDVVQDSNENSNANTFYIPEGQNLQSSTQYFWRVRYKNVSYGGIWESWSKTFPFTVNMIPPSPSDLTVIKRI